MQLILDECHEGVLIVDRKEVICAFNKSFSDCFHLDHVTIDIGSPFRKFWQELITGCHVPASYKDPDGWLESILQKFSKDHGFFELELSCGKVLEFHFSRMPSGELVCVFENVTDYLELEKRGGETWASLEATLDGMDEGFCLLDRELNVSNWNSKLYELLVIPKYLHGPQKPLATLLHLLADRGDLGEGDTASLVGVHMARIKSKQHDRFVATVPDGRIIELRFSPSPRGDTVVLAQDVTQQMCFEQALKDSYNSLLSVIDAIPAIIDAKDDSGRYKFVNSEFIRIFGGNRKQIVGKTTEEVLGREIGQLTDTLDRHLVRSEASGYKLEENFGTDGDNSRTWLTQKVITKQQSENAPSLLTVRFDVTDRIKAESRLDQAMYYDGLTGLPNRHSLIMNLEKNVISAAKSGTAFGLLFLNIRGFNRINSGLGPQYADSLMRQISRRISNLIPPGDFLARSGRHEFSILMLGTRDKSAICEFSRQILETLKDAFVLEGKPVHVNGSIGISMCPDNGLNPAQLLRAADVALETSMTNPAQGCCFYREGVFDHLKNHIEIEAALHAADFSNEFQVFYQPQICLRTGCVIGAEALLRWNHPVLGSIPPSTFIPVAEKSGIITDLGNWTLRTVCNDLKGWGENSPDKVAINYSSVQFHCESVLSDLSGTITQSGVPVEKLQIEITENVAMDDIGRAEDILRKMKDIGVRLSMDDFGTGYSSLSYLRKLPFDELKIDKSFVDDLPKDSSCVSIAKSIITLGHNLGMTVLAEGIEHDVQRTCLLKAGCDDAQGYLYSRPVKKTAFEEILSVE